MFETTALPNRRPGSLSFLDVLRLIARDVDRAPDVETALQIIVRRIRSAMKADVCTVYVTEDESQRHVIRATDGLRPDVLGRVQFGYGEGLIGRVAERTEPMNLDHVPKGLDDGFLAQSGEGIFHGFLGTPITHRGTVLGVLVVRQRAARRFHDSEEAFLVTLAAQLGGVIASAKASGAICGACGPDAAGERSLDGIGSAPGVALGSAVVVFPPAELGAVPDRKPEDPAGEEAAFRAAVTRTADELTRLAEGVDENKRATERTLFDAYVMILESRDLTDTTVQRIRAGNWAPGALRDTIEQYAQGFEKAEDAYLRERARDIRDLGARILHHMQSRKPVQIEYPPDTILVGKNISAIDLAEVPAGQLAGVVSARGSSFSHMAIVARTMGVPVVTGVEEVSLSALEGQPLAVDGHQGRIYLRPAPALRAAVVRVDEEQRQLSAELKGLYNAPAQTPDGLRIPLYVNAGLPADIGLSLEAGADGIGLYRTELTFMTRSQFPTEEEQRALYREILEACAPRPVTLRTLDVGGDKPLPYFPVHDTNPMLGWRGIRISLDHPEIFLTQIRAALRAAEGLGNLNLLLPMVSGADEVEQAQNLIGQAYRELADEGLEIVAPRVGAMIEIPSAVYQAEDLARRVDFLSVGTNDLAQYLLAADRGNRRVARLLDPLHPALLHALQQVCDAGRRVGKPVNVCGETAGDPGMALLLLGMGVTSLSVSVGDLLRVKSVIRSFTRTRARQLLVAALSHDRPGLTRELVTETLRDVGLAGLSGGRELSPKTVGR